MESSSRHSATRRRSPPESVVDVGVARREPEGVHGDLEGPLEVPGAGGVDLVLQLGLLGQQLVEVGVGLAHRRADLVEAVDQGLGLGDAVGDVAEHVLGRVELGLLGQEADGEAAGEAGLAGEAVVLAGHDLEQRRLSRAVGADDPDLGPGIEGEVDALQHLPVGRIEPPQVAHGVDVLGCHADQCGPAGRRRGTTGPVMEVRLPVQRCPIAEVALRQ